jgi:nucleotide-binding universal stress UspA family protein
MAPDQIILATDFSPASTAASSMAARMAQLFKCRILLIHVFQYVAHHQYKIPVGWMIEIIRNDVKRQILNVRQAFTEMNIETETLLVEDGFPVVEILNAAQSHKASVIVMGTHAVGGMDRFLLGSTAEGVLRGAICPVITVGPHVQPANAPQGIRRLLFATDFSKESLNAVPFVAMLRDAAVASLQVLHVQADIDSVETSETPLLDSLRMALDAPDTARQHSATKYLTLHGAAVAQAISNEAERLPADLVILGVKRASAFAAHLAPKVAFQVIAAAPCAVLTISS